jgi:hypothetical protein
MPRECKPLTPGFDERHRPEADEERVGCAADQCIHRYVFSCQRRCRYVAARS